jgi:hypothetical protein
MIVYYISRRIRCGADSCGTIVTTWLKEHRSLSFIAFGGPLAKAGLSPGVAS